MTTARPCLRPSSPTRLTTPGSRGTSANICVLRSPPVRTDGAYRFVSAQTDSKSSGCRFYSPIFGPVVWPGPHLFHERATWLRKKRPRPTPTSATARWMTSRSGSSRPIAPPRLAPDAPDPFDPAALRLSDAGMAGLGVKKALLTVPVRKPDKIWFVRAHPDSGLPAPDGRHRAEGGPRRRNLPRRPAPLAGPGGRIARSARGPCSPPSTARASLFLWPVRLPGPDGRLDEWSRSALEAADLAAPGWVRVSREHGARARTTCSRRPATSRTRVAGPAVPGPAPGRRSRTGSSTVRGPPGPAPAPRGGVTVDALRHYREVWAVDFEFTAPPGHRPTPLCVVARELRSGRLGRLWLADGPPAAPPYPTGPDTLFVAYYARPNWVPPGPRLAVPARVLDLFAEFRNLTNGRPVPARQRAARGAGLLRAATAWTRPRRRRCGTWRSGAGRTPTPSGTALLDYCQTDVDALARLLPGHAPAPRPAPGPAPRPVHGRGRPDGVGRRADRRRTPSPALRDDWDRIKGRLVREVDREYGVFVPAGRHRSTRTRGSGPR